MEARSAQGMDIFDVLITLSRRRWFIAGFSFSVAVVTAVILLLIPSEYQSTTLVMPPGQSSSGAAILSQLGGAGSLASMAGAGLGIKTPGALYLALFRSRTLEDTLVQRFGLRDRYKQKMMSGARGAFEKHTVLALGTKDGLITITVEDRDPKMAAEIANGYVEEFRKFSANLSISEASQRRIFFEQQMREAKEKLGTAEEEMKTTEQTTGVLQVDGQTRALIDAAASLRAQVMAKEVQIQGMRSYATEDNPQMVQAKQQLVALEDQLSRLGGVDQDTGMILPKGKVSQNGLEYLRKLRDMKYYETIYELISKQYEMAKLDEAGQGGTIQVVDEAVPPDRRSYPRRGNVLFVVVFLSLLVSCTWVFVRERQRLNRDQGSHSRLNDLWATFR